MRGAHGSLTTWTYDKTYRLTNEERSGTSPFFGENHYDQVGNRIE